MAAQHAAALLRQQQTALLRASLRRYRLKSISAGWQPSAMAEKPGYQPCHQ